MNEKPGCPRCEANEVIKNGAAKDKPRFKCKKCNLQFTHVTPRDYPPETRAIVIELYNHGLSVRAATKLAGVSGTSALNWSRSWQKKSVRNLLREPLFRTDNYAAYAEVIDEEKLFLGKSQTCYLEQNNGRQRHSYARFRRKSIAVSKTLEMVNLTMALFAAFHVNGTAKNILSLLN